MKFIHFKTSQTHVRKVTEEEDGEEDEEEVAGVF
jgi:hypothetical protein